MAVSSSELIPETAGDAWRALAHAETAEQLCSAWLEVLCRGVLSAHAGLVLLVQADGSYAPVAALPAARDLSYLTEIATDALRTREGVVRHDELGHARLAYPLQTREQLHGAVVLDLGVSEDAALDRGLRLTHWGAGWLVDMLHQRELVKQESRTRQGGFLFPGNQR